MLVEFYGGPIDGELREIDGESNHYFVAIAPQLSFDCLVKASGPRQAMYVKEGPSLTAGITRYAFRGISSPL